MKKSLIILFAVLSLNACKKNELNGINANVPKEIVGQWIYGTFSMTEFWGYDGSYQGNAFELSIAFNFMENGQYEMFFISTANDYGCRTEAFSYYKGSVNWDTEGEFTVTPTEGNFRGFYACSPQYNFDRAALQSELVSQTYYYTFETDDYGKTYLVIRFDPADEYPTYFSETNW